MGGDMVLSSCWARNTTQYLLHIRAAGDKVTTGQLHDYTRTVCDKD